MNYISENIRFLRVVAGLSQAELAEQVGLNRANIASYERKIAQPSIEALIKMSELFQVQLLKIVQEDLSIEAQNNPADNEFTQKADTPEKTPKIVNNIQEAQNNNSVATNNKVKTNLDINMMQKELQDLPKQIQFVTQAIEKINGQMNRINFYKDINSIAKTLERLANTLEKRTK